MQLSRNYTRSLAVKVSACYNLGLEGVVYGRLIFKEA